MTATRLNAAFVAAFATLLTFAATALTSPAAELAALA